jgi:hypothetical protein
LVVFFRLLRGNRSSSSSETSISGLCCRLRFVCTTVTSGSSPSGSLLAAARLRLRDAGFALTFELFRRLSSSDESSEGAASTSELPNMPFSVCTGKPSFMPLSVSSNRLSSLDESTTVTFEPLLDLALEARVGVEAAALLDGVAPIVAAGEGFAAGEKLIVVCRLRSRAFLAMAIGAAVNDTRYAVVG